MTLAPPEPVEQSRRSLSLVYREKMGQGECSKAGFLAVMMVSGVVVVVVVVNDVVVGGLVQDSRVRPGMNCRKSRFEAKDTLLFLLGRSSRLFVKFALRLGFFWFHQTSSTRRSSSHHQFANGFESSK